jgi:hypothetical protein
VIGIDPSGLAALLGLTGPVTVPTLPEPISTANGLDVILQAPEELYGDVAHAVLDVLTRTDMGNPRALSTALAQAADEQHLRLWLRRQAEQTLMAALRLDGSLGPVAGDSLLVVDQNLAPATIGSSLQRTVAYDVRLQPRAGRRDATLDGRVQVTLENAGPPDGLGENRTTLSVYSPFALVGATLNGTPTAAASHLDLGRSAHSLTVSVPSHQATSVNMDLRGEARLSEDGWYRLDLLRQPSGRPDRVSASVSVPKGWRVAETRDATVSGTGSRRVTFEGTDPAPATIWVRVERTGLGRIWDKLVRAG